MGLTLLSLYFFLDIFHFLALGLMLYKQFGYLKSLQYCQETNFASAGGEIRSGCIAVEEAENVVKGPKEHVYTMELSVNEEGKGTIIERERSTE